MIEYYITMIAIAYLVNLLTHASPIAVFIQSFWSNRPMKKHHPISQLVFMLLSCSKCMGFWIGLIYYQALVPALLLSLAAIIIEKMI